MHSRERGRGWSAVIQPEELEELEKLGDEPATDPHMVVDEAFSFDDPPTTRSPMPDFSLEGHAATPEVLGGADDPTPPPALSLDPSAGAPPPPLGEGRRLRLPIPGGGGGRARGSAEPVRPGGPALGGGFAITIGAATPPPAVEDARPRDAGVVDALAPLSSAELVDKLSEPLAPRAAKPTPWREYRELIRTIVGGVVVIAGVIAYQLLRDDAPAADGGGQARVLVAPKVGPTSGGAGATSGPLTAPPGPSKAGGDPSAAGRSTGAERTGEPVGANASVVASEPVDPQPGVEASTASRIQKTKTPMVTIVSAPAGALVEINGTIYGNTPLIMPSPAQVERLAVRLKLDKYKSWDGTVTTNEAGHFSLNVQLDKAR